jgi:transposase
VGQVTIISGNVRRRSWSDEEKRAFVMRAFAPGATVSQVAADADIHTSLLFRWRRELRGRGGLKNPDRGLSGLPA